ncbi:DNA alkylation repair protein [Neogemmobacter tilapiae]|uniref:DNA alkylation repair protein n=1 Tax=Neogemmobacter tilapiae TaxID=875041 RepID=A0A918TQG0_9RHOB|nr:DNA alkylation repair protein [Gemmobacter tilapiae]GHC58114.1 DNA alkylation repair protein [Gemmobacter tilapiae]
MNASDILQRLADLGDAQKAQEMAAYHKADRPYDGIALPDLDPLLAELRPLPVETRVDLAADLWASNRHEAMILAAKMLTQARMNPDQAVWDLISGWVPGFDAWAIADHACKAGERRLVADPARLDQVEGWLNHETMWVRRAALVMTLPWTKQNHPSEDEIAVRDRVLDWCVFLAPDRDWFIQKAIAWWLRELSKHDPEHVRGFLAEHGESLKKFARVEAGRLL